MRHDELDEVIVMQGVKGADHAAAELAVRPFQSVHMPSVLPAPSARERLSEESNDFGFDSAMLALHPTRDGDESADQNISAHQVRKRAKISFLDGMALTIGLQIGSGIFSSPGIVTVHAGSIGMSVLVWIISGCLTLTGANSFAELASTIPLNGGAQAYLQYSFGPLISFLYSWTAIVALKPSSGAIIATILGEYTTRVTVHLVNGASGGFQKYHVGELPHTIIKAIATCAVLVIIFLQSCHARAGTQVQNAVTLVKIVLLVSIPVMAVVAMARGQIPPESRAAFSSFSNLFNGSTRMPTQYALALYSALWAYDGWDQVSFVAGEMQNPKRDAPKAIRYSVLLVTLLFVSVILSYFVVLPQSVVASSNSVALDFGSSIFGFTGGVFFGALVAFSCFGALNGHIFTYSRLVYAAGQESFLPACIGDLHKRLRTPLNANLISAALIVSFVVFGSGFASLVNFCGICAWFWYGAAVLGLLYLRIKDPGLHRPYQTWTIVPIVFVAIAIFLLVMPIFAAPLEALAAFGFLGMGVPMYYITQHSEAVLRTQQMGSGHGFERVPTEAHDTEPASFDGQL
ncbi:hypothetical protein MVES1_002032 [Malassezia vespertilionis]|uniref:Amino acid transporter n=1 Tax=Malassezia vespertilionis TaxID=2020962 RepID=A0A2N1JBT1_9BASI|nr:uncharacterized protein MVES1_002032 [Malassezia vespertilionis]PKI83992.1 hypothetical protein MVES_001925 [Malassezia vespertilionis]WFD06678.1 hypothetical protein MVES1_002032 [Malassezia vespertilionis]